MTDTVEIAWKIGRPTIGGLVRAFAPLRVYGAERVPLEGGLVMAFNHFSWIDPPVFGNASPRTMRFLAKIEAHRMPGLGQLIRIFGTISRIIRTASRSDSPRRTENVPNARISWPRPGTRCASIFAM